jgi:hypothetical protein
MGVPPVPFRMTEDQMDIRLRLGRLSALLDIAATPLPGACKRRSKNPSLKRPVGPVAPE